MKPRVPFHLLKFACIATLAVLAIPGGDPVQAQPNCNQPCLGGMRCNPAHAETPAAHTGAHTCGGQYTETAVSGNCITGTEDESCDLGLSLVLVGTYACSQQGASCTHTFINSGYAYACNC